MFVQVLHTNFKKHLTYKQIQVNCDVIISQSLKTRTNIALSMKPLTSTVDMVLFNEL